MFEIEVIICIKMDLALDNQQRLIYHKIQITNYLFLSKSIWSTDETLTGTTIPSRNGRGSNGNEQLLHTPPKSGTGALSLGTI